MIFPCSGKLADIQFWSIHLLAAGFCLFLVDRFLQVNEFVVKKKFFYDTREKIMMMQFDLA